MRKLLTILLSVCVMLGCISLTACSEQEPTTGSGNQVTAAEYSAAMQLNGNFKFVMNTVTPDYEATTTYLVDGNKIEMKNVQDTVETGHIYLLKDGDEYFMYSQVNDAWVKGPSNAQNYDYYKDFPSTATRIYSSITFDMLQYDDTEKCYTFTQTAEGMTGVFKIYFENKKLSKLISVVTHTEDGETSSTQIVFSYNETITLPVQGGEEKGENSLTASNYASILSLSALNCTADCIYVSSYGKEHTIWTIYNGNLYMQVLMGDTVVYEEYYSKEESVYFYYEKDSDTGSWKKEPIDESNYLGQMSTCDFSLIFDFEDWTFDSESGKYVCASKTIEIFGDIYNFTDAYLVIKDGKMVECGMKEGSDVYTYNISYEGTVINLPVIG